MNNTRQAFRLVIKRKLRTQKNLFEVETYLHHVVATNWTEEAMSGFEKLELFLGIRRRIYELNLASDA